MFDANHATAPNPITAQASWDAFKAATDSTKIVLTPIMANVIINSSEKQSEGGNTNETAFGVEQYLGEGAVEVTGEFRNLTPAQKKALTQFSYESDISLGVENLTVYMINKNNEVFHNEVTAGQAKGIPLYNFRVGSRGSQGFNSDDKIPFSYSLRPEWDETIAKAQPAFSLLSY